MTYLIFEIVLCLIAATALGLLVGWLLWGRSTPAPDCSALERDLDDAQSVIHSLERELAARPRTPEASDLPPMRREPRLDPLPPPVRARTAPLAPEVFETEEPVSDLDPVPYEDTFEDAGDGPAEATFSDDLPPSPAPLPPEAERPSSPTYDDLKRISGIGPAIESQLAEIGITTYRQIAHFTDEDIERVGAHIDFFADRIRREGWVVQAAALHRQTYGTQA